MFHLYYPREWDFAEEKSRIHHFFFSNNKLYLVCIILDRLTNYFAQFQPIWELGWWHRPQTRNRLLSRKYPWIYTHAWRWRMWRYSSSTRYFVSLKLMFPPTKHTHTHAHTHSNNKNSNNNNNNNLVNKESDCGMFYMNILKIIQDIAKYVGNRRPTSAFWET